MSKNNLRIHLAQNGSHAAQDREFVENLEVVSNRCMPVCTEQSRGSLGFHPTTPDQLAGREAGAAAITRREIPIMNVPTEFPQECQGTCAPELDVVRMRDNGEGR